MAETTQPESPPTIPQQPAKPWKPKPLKESHTILPELRERYPKAFPKNPEAVMPLQIGLHKQLIEAGYDRRALFKAFKFYTNSRAYLAALAAGKPRVNLDGEPVGPVSEEHQQEAAAELANPGTRVPLQTTSQPKPIALAGQIDASKSQPQQKTPMTPISLKGLQAKISVTIDSATFSATLKVDTMGAKSVPVVIDIAGKAYTANLNPKSFRKAQAAFQEAAQPVVSISGTLKGDVIDGAGILVFDKGGKAASAEVKAPAKAPEPEAAASAEAKAPEPEVAGSGRPKLSLKPKSGS
jgi:sRNA-binding protein